MAGELDWAKQLLRRAAEDEAAAKALLPVTSVTDAESANSVPKYRLPGHRQSVPWDRLSARC